MYAKGQTMNVGDEVAFWIDGIQYLGRISNIFGDGFCRINVQNGPRKQIDLHEDSITWLSASPESKCECGGYKHFKIQQFQVGHALWCDWNHNKIPMV